MDISVLEKKSNIERIIFAIVLIVLIVGGIFYFIKVTMVKYGLMYGWKMRLFGLLSR